MAYKNKMVTINVPADLVERVRQLPLGLKSPTKRIEYLIKLGVRYHAIMEMAKAETEG